ncbi:glycine receptor subunit alpha-2-like [Ylistrum balloti]|uniref:glycine receptor subunit alpha-2-like n=1 Tax=Ylistrum balloti TaxID=509963 RepID=UPI002905DA71|nr:glycine receptor subunit alpha-2-like [Ylistrum balloti]XP_060083950.1 glycine receptor subunit alpha-2-like [Ylistrum balloti]
MLRMLTVAMEWMTLPVLIILMGCFPGITWGTREQLLNNITAGYDPRIPPGYETNTPVTSYVQLYILSIDSVSDSTMDFGMSMFIRQRWNDERLKYTTIGGLSHLELDTKMIGNIWVPDLYIVNEKKASFHIVTVPNKLMHIYPNGDVFYSMRVSGRFACNMHLHKYPLDEQRCSLRLESYGYSVETLLLRWNDNPVEKSPKLSLPQFEMGDITDHICDVTYAGVNYTCITMSLKLSRNYGYYMIQVFIPSILIVFLSWVSFWLNIEAVPARISLGLLTVLTMTTQSSGARATLPRVSYVKAIDVWMSICLLFVFAALIEFAYVNVLARVEQRRRQTIRSKGPPPIDEENGKGEESSGPQKMGKFFKDALRRERARNVDKLSRIIFPLIFGIFNLCFWTVYIFWQPQEVIDADAEVMLEG